MAKKYSGNGEISVALKGISYDYDAAAADSLRKIAVENVKEEWEEDNEDPNAVFSERAMATEIEDEMRELWRCEKGLPKTVVVSSSMDKSEAENLTRMAAARLLAPELPEGVSVHEVTATCVATPKDKMDYRVYKAFTEMLDRTEFQKVLALSKLNYSFHNTMSVYAKKPNATIVRGFQTWKNDFNRVPTTGSGIPIIAISVPSLKNASITSDADIVAFIQKHYSWLNPKSYQKTLDRARDDAANGKDIYGPTWYKELYVFDVSDTALIEGKEDILGKTLNFDKKAIKALSGEELSVIEKINEDALQPYGVTEGILSDGSLYGMLTAYGKEFFERHTKDIVGIGNPYPEEGLAHTVETLLFVGLVSEQQEFGLSDTVSKELQQAFLSARYTDKQAMFEQMLKRATALCKQWTAAYKTAAKERKKSDVDKTDPGNR